MVTLNLRTKCSGFSLVELSVVLVLIALVIGGTMAGLSLKHNAELKSIPTEVERLKELIATFNQRYDSLPGDLYNATTLWGAADADHNTCIATASTGKPTCNGDGNGWVTTPGTGSTYYEAHRFWQHLSNAGLISSSYTGQRLAAGEDVTCLPEHHCGMATFRNGLFYAATVNDDTGYFNASTYPPALELFDGDKGNSILFFRRMVSGATGAHVGSPVLTIEEAYNIDLKFDDGKPSTGAIQTFEPIDAEYLTTYCASSDVEATAEYALWVNDIHCALIFTHAF